MQIVNPTEEPITLPKFSIIASISPVIEISVQSMSHDENESPKYVANTNINREKCNVESKQKTNIDFDLSTSDMTNDQKHRLNIFLQQNRDVFAAEISELGKCNIAEHEIETGNHIPVRLLPYRATPKAKEEIEKQVDKMLANEIIVQSTSPYTSQVVLCQKKDQTFRFCIDYRKLSSITKPMSYPLPNLSDVFDAIGEEKASTFSVLDLCQGFWQIGLNKNSREKAAFVTHSGVYEWTRMSFGLRNSSITFSRVIVQVLQGLNWKNVLAYIDDIMIFSTNFEDHIKHLNQIFDRLKKANLKLKPSKCKFGVKEVAYLGHILSKMVLKWTLTK